jgi:hypothetical protein
MPIHDWSRVKPGTFHNFHYRWVAAIMDALNGGVLPSGYFAMAEQIIGGPEGDVVTLDRSANGHPDRPDGGGIAVADVPPKTTFVIPVELERYAAKANQVAIHHEYIYEAWNRTSFDTIDASDLIYESPYPKTRAPARHSSHQVYRRRSAKQPLRLVVLPLRAMEIGNHAYFHRTVTADSATIVPLRGACRSRGTPAPDRLRSRCRRGPARRPRPDLFQLDRVGRRTGRPDVLDLGRAGEIGRPVENEPPLRHPGRGGRGIRGRRP